MLKRKFKNINNTNKKSKIKAYMISSITFSIIFWLLLILYLYIGIKDNRFYNVTKYFKIIITVLGLIFTIVGFWLQQVYYKLKFKERDM